MQLFEGLTLATLLVTLLSFFMPSSRRPPPPALIQPGEIAGAVVT